MYVGHGRYLANGLHALRNAPERALQQRHDAVGLEVAAEDDSHVRAHVILLVEAFHVRQLGVLQVLGASDDRIGIGLRAEKLLEHRLAQRGCHVVARPVLLLVDGLQLTLEHAEHGIDESVAVQLAPLLHVLRREHVVIESEVVRRSSVQSTTAITRDEGVELVGDGKFASLLAQSVDVLLNSRALGFVLGGGKTVVGGGDAVEPRLFLRIVDGADFVGSLEHDVLKIVGDTRVGAVFRARVHHHGAKHLGLRVVFVEPHGHTVAQLLLFHFQRLRHLGPSLARQCQCQRHSKHSHPLYSSHCSIWFVQCCKYTKKTPT